MDKKEDLPRVGISVTMTREEVDAMDSIIDANAQATGTQVSRNDWLRNVARERMGLPLIPLNAPAKVELTNVNPGRKSFMRDDAPLEEKKHG